MKVIFAVVKQLKHCSWKESPEQNLRLQRDLNPWVHDTGAMFYQPSSEASLQAGQRGFRIAHSVSSWIQIPLKPQILFWASFATASVASQAKITFISSSVYVGQEKSIKMHLSSGQSSLLFSLANFNSTCPLGKLERTERTNVLQAYCLSRKMSEELSLCP